MEHLKHTTKLHAYTYNTTSYTYPNMSVSKKQIHRNGAPVHNKHDSSEKTSLQQALRAYTLAIFSNIGATDSHLYDLQCRNQSW